MLGHQSADQEIGDPGGGGFAVDDSQEKNLLGVTAMSSSSAACAAGLGSSDVIVEAVPIEVAVVLSKSNELEQGNGGLARSVPTVGEDGKPKYQDVPFLVAFIVHMVFVLVVGLAVGIPALQYSDEYPGINSTSPPINASAGSATVQSSSASLAAPIGIALLTAVPLSFAALYLIQMHAMAAVKCMMVV